MHPDAVSGGKLGRSRDGCIIWGIGSGERRMGRGRSRKCSAVFHVSTYHSPVIYRVRLKNFPTKIQLFAK